MTASAGGQLTAALSVLPGAPPLPMYSLFLSWLSSPLSAGYQGRSRLPLTLGIAVAASHPSLRQTQPSLLLPCCSVASLPSFISRPASHPSWLLVSLFRILSLHFRHQDPVAPSQLLPSPTSQAVSMLLVVGWASRFSCCSKGITNSSGFVSSSSG